MGVHVILKHAEADCLRNVLLQGETGPVAIIEGA
jgi:hypothetical protein